MNAPVPTILTHLQSLAQIPASVRFVSKVLLGSFLIALSAQIAIPFWPVPMTMQTAAIMSLGLIASPKVAVGSVVAYIIEGAIGLPVFSGFSSGISALTSTTGGYIFGFIPMIHVISVLKDKTTSLWGRFGICLLGQTMLYIVGVSYLSLLIGFSAAVQLGFLPFIIKIPASILFSIFGIEALKGMKKS